MRKMIYVMLAMFGMISCSQAQNSISEKTGTSGSNDSEVSDINNNQFRDSLKRVLSQEEYEVTCNAGTEPAFSGEYWDHKENGDYHCKVCNSLLFNSEHKYKSGSGWPSFYQSAADSTVSYKVDSSFGVKRVEINCARCDAHLGHVFEDGPMPTGQRYCVNSASLKFEQNKGVKK